MRTNERDFLAISNSSVIGLLFEACHTRAGVGHRYSAIGRQTKPFWTRRISLMNELSSILMSSAGREIITTVIAFHWLRINIGKTNFAELMMVNYMKVKLTERRIGRIVVKVLNSLFSECAIITFCVVCVNSLIIIKRKTCSLFIFSPGWLHGVREFFGLACKALLARGGSLYSPRNFKTLQLYNYELNMTGCTGSAFGLIVPLAKKEKIHNDDNWTWHRNVKYFGSLSL